MHLEMGRLVCVAGKTVGNYLEAGWGGVRGESLKGAVCVFSLYPTLFRLAFV